MISGEMTFRNSPYSDFDGSITWLGTEIPFVNDVVKAYVNNFVVQVDVLGSFYRSVNGTSLLRVGAQAPNAQLTFSGGAVDSPVYKHINLSSRNQASFVPRASGDGMSITPNLGFFSGSFSSDGRIGRFRGAILQKLNMGVGFFSEAGQYGDVGLEAE